ncbi:TetR/AcrR family transcriptional regulator [Ferdinandcohnia quinoae]|uniref:TetR/AcrR family transcriptional regulator n=1 Tax=Fredinandcohnia quinoae TaxID=2918902 RepID=A0AAW5E7G5_9BACI|nr:TetR/AcrR family transcriptional regulator [Fredinandcohnia sp. SECRCQ15]MCH1625962.1 TetR/AcrR family transcriptional regulator [Fredinandcohnia sp. SECRCQ15]
MVKKQLIMEKAIELFAKQGFEATSVQQITEQCGISKGAFYLSFKSKGELIVALIDHFMMQFTSDIDHLVRYSKDDEQLLYKFYYATFTAFNKHSDFAKILMKEQTQSLNEEFLVKMHYYNRIVEENIQNMLERLYGDEVNQIKYDLVYCVKGFMSMYSELFLFHKLSLDMETLCESLVEKTRLLAKHTTIPFITKEIIGMTRTQIEEVTKEQIIDAIDQKIEEIEEPIVSESMVLLKQQLQVPNHSPAIVKGLLENIRNHPHCKWISYLIRSYFQLY